VSSQKGNRGRFEPDLRSGNGIIAAVANDDFVACFMGLSELTDPNSTISIAFPTVPPHQLDRSGKSRPSRDLRG